MFFLIKRQLLLHNKASKPVGYVMFIFLLLSRRKGNFLGFGVWPVTGAAISDFLGGLFLVCGNLRHELLRKAISMRNDNLKNTHILFILQISKCDTCPSPTWRSIFFGSANMRPTFVSTVSFNSIKQFAKNQLIQKHPYCPVSAKKLAHWLL